jgi:micrococcal nuclease
MVVENLPIPRAMKKSLFIQVMGFSSLLYLGQMLISHQCLLGDCFHPQVFYTSVKKILDGDTFIIGNHRLRLLGIDAPEMGQGLMGEKSKRYLEQRLANKKVKVVVFKRDHYGRLLGLLFDQKINLNQEMVKKGWAVIYPFSTELTRTQLKEFKKMEKLAKQQREGVWSVKKFERPWNYRKRIKKEKALIAAQKER